MRWSQAVHNAIKAGYRLFDGACDYGNEKAAGEGIRRALNEGIVKREELCKLPSSHLLLSSLLHFCVSFVVITTKVRKRPSLMTTLNYRHHFLALEHLSRARSCKAFIVCCLVKALTASSLGKAGGEDTARTLGSRLFRPIPGTFPCRLGIRRSEASLSPRMVGR